MNERFNCEVCAKDKRRSGIYRYTGSGKPVRMTCPRCESPMKLLGKELGNSTEAEPKQLYKVSMLCALCGHRFEQVTAQTGYGPHRCPKCELYSARRIWQSPVTLVETTARTSRGERPGK